jgi:hypothetical protein
MLDEYEFQTWLESHKPEDCVGLSHRVNGCPIFEWLLSKTGRWCNVGRTTYRIGDERFTPEQAMPRWARRFVYDLDRTRSFGGMPVSARDALKVLIESRNNPI